MEDWPHQIQGVSDIAAHFDAGGKDCVVTSPTGGGKSRMAVRMMQWAGRRDWAVVYYTPRKMLTSQTGRVLREMGMSFGIRAAEFDKEYRPGEMIQIASPSTEDARYFQRNEPLSISGENWVPHNAQLVLVDEIHMQKSDRMQRILEWHRGHGAVIVMFTATPIGVSHLSQHLIVAGTLSQLRKYDPPALLPATVYACEEFDTTKIDRIRTTVEIPGKAIEEIWTPAIYGFVEHHYWRLNPEQKPAILFAPGVEHAKWFAEEFCEKGIKAAHIDGECVWVDGQFYPTDRKKRDEVLERVRSGDIKVLCNRFVCREGLDLPELYHCILATPIGSLVSYLQICGRVLRASPGLDRVIIQDHGGSWWRHGSPNQDRDWRDFFNKSEARIIAERKERICSGEEREPIRCPKCTGCRTHGNVCPHCGYFHTTKSRVVFQHDGELKEMSGDLFRPRKTKLQPDTEKLWTGIYFGCKKAKKPMTFRQAEGAFYRRYRYFPPRALRFMPIADADWFRKIPEVDMKDLH